MGNKSSRQVQALNEIVTNITFDTIININNSCKATATTGQEMNINIGASARDCLQFGYDPMQCAELMSSNINVEDVQQLFQVEIDSSCELNDENTVTLQNAIAAELSAKASQENDETGAFLRGLTQMLGGGSGDNVSVQNTIENTIKNTFTKNNVNEMVKAFVGQQRLEIVIELAKNVNVKNVKQEIRSQVVGNMISKNEALIQAINDLDYQASAGGGQKNKGLTDIVDSVVGGIASLVGSVTNAYIAIAVVVALVCCLSSVMLPAIFMAAGKSGVSKNFAGVATAAINKAGGRRF